MGSQINFFLGPSDLKSLRDCLNKKLDFVLLTISISQNTLLEVSNIIPDYGSEELRVFLARQEDLSEIRARLENPGPSFFVSTQYLPVIEFDRPYVGKTKIRAGRLYRSDDFWLEKGARQTKPPEWVAWAKRVFLRTRKCLTKVGDTFYFAGEEAIAMRADGVLFQQIDDPRETVPDSVSP